MLYLSLGTQAGLRACCSFFTFWSSVPGRAAWLAMSFRRRRPKKESLDICWIKNPRRRLVERVGDVLDLTWNPNNGITTYIDKNIMTRRR